MKNLNSSNEESTSLPSIEINEEIGSLSQRIDWGLRQLNVPSTWSVTKGEGITVMVIDTGHPVHPDIGDNAIAGKNFIPGEPIEDENGHQLHCTGIICAKDNETGMVGVAPNAKTISVKALSKSGRGSYTGLASALDYAIEIKPDLVSMSLGGSSPSSALQSRIKKLYEMDIPVVCAAGNTGSGGVNYPAAFDETIAVAAYDKYGKVANFSSKGEKVEWAAPGVNVYSTYLNNGYASLSGTSMACPFIAGVIALMLSKHKKQEADTGYNDCKTVAQIREHLLKYTNDKGEVGRDNSWGYGVIDIEKLIKDESPVDNPVPTTPTPTPVPTPTPTPSPMHPLFLHSLSEVTKGEDSELRYYVEYSNNGIIERANIENSTDYGETWKIVNDCLINQGSYLKQRSGDESRPTTGLFRLRGQKSGRISSSVSYNDKVDDETPTPSPVLPTPTPSPVLSTPTPTKINDKPKKSKKTLFIVIGLVILSLIVGMAISSNKKDIPSLPYIDESGDINWNKKFESELENK